MPCSSSEGMTSAPDYSDFKRLKDEMDTMTRILCEVMGCIPPDVVAQMSPTTKLWIEAHQKFDKEQGR